MRSLVKRPTDVTILVADELVRAVASPYRQSFVDDDVANDNTLPPRHRRRTHRQKSPCARRRGRWWLRLHAAYCIIGGPPGPMRHHGPYTWPSTFAHHLVIKVTQRRRK